MQQSQQIGVKRLTKQQEEKLNSARKLVDTRIQQTKVEIEKFNSKMDQFKTENATSKNQQQYFQDRRKFIFTNIRILQAHLGKLIQAQAILGDKDIEFNKFEEVLNSMDVLSKENLEIMKSFQTLVQVPNDQPLPKDFIMMSERVQRNYNVPIREDELDDRFKGLNNYFQNEIQKFYKTPQNAPYLQFVPKLT